jgi:hypothetical protein
MARRPADGVALLRWSSGGVSWFAWVVTVRACCVLVSGDRLASSPFSWRGWCRCGECDARCIAVGVRVSTRRVSCRHCACVAVTCDAGPCSCGSSNSRSRRGEWSLRPVRRYLACVVTCGVADVLLLSQTRPAATTSVIPDAHCSNTVALLQAFYSPATAKKSSCSHATAKLLQHRCRPMQTGNL